MVGVESAILQYGADAPEYPPFCTKSSVEHSIKFLTLTFYRSVRNGPKGFLMSSTWKYFAFANGLGVA